MADRKYLTKSLFKLACECPVKLYYANNEAYENPKLNDPFLEALADGGYKDGELAKHYYAGGTEIITPFHKDALSQTRALLEQESVTCYEGAFSFRNL